MKVALKNAQKNVSLPKPPHVGTLEDSSDEDNVQLGSFLTPPATTPMLSSNTNLNTLPNVNKNQRLGLMDTIQKI